MGRVPDDEIERLGEISLERLCEARGVVLEKRGADLVGRCPFHEDRTPSFVVTPSANLWHCLGACQAGGSVIDFVMRADGVSLVIPLFDAQGRVVQLYGRKVRDDLREGTPKHLYLPGTAPRGLQPGWRWSTRRR
ncbi:MAG: hypothetical protein IPG04_25250 [Polyangiaceae bacterium]|nr:hypothetical protein [Polyangiaceae bacterium]